MVLNEGPEGGKARRTWNGLVSATCAEIGATGSFSADRVAARAGASPATFYAYFASKDAALTAVFSRALDSMLAVIDESMTVEHLLDGHGRRARHEGGRVVHSPKRGRVAWADAPVRHPRRLPGGVLDHGVDVGGVVHSKQFLASGRPRLHQYERARGDEPVRLDEIDRE